MVGVVGNHKGRIAKGGAYGGAIGRLQFAGVIAINVIRVLQDIAGENTHQIRIGPDDATGDQLFDAGEGCGRGRFTTDTALADA